MSKKEQYQGVLIGIVEMPDGNPTIAIGVHGRQAILGPTQALLLWHHLGDILDTLGELDEDDVEIEGSKPLCH